MTRSQKSRMVCIFLFFIACYIFILAHLYRIQIHQNLFFTKMAQQQYKGTMIHNPPRADIYDRMGQPLAMNKDTLAAFIMPHALHNPEELKLFLQKQFPAAYERLEKNGTSHFMYIQRRLKPSDITLIEQAKLSDIYFLKEPSRFYPLDCSGQLIGITDIDNRGLFGLELHYDTQLAGKPTTFFLEKDARSGHFYFKKETKIEGHQGSPITLTIDSNLQFLAYEELSENIKKFGSQEGSVIIMDPTKGDILAMVSCPCFNPQDTSAIDFEKAKNKVITEVYEFGSVMKIFAALAAFEENVATPEELINCENTKSTFINGIRVNTVKENGILSFSEVIEQSNNIGTVKVALRLGPKLYDHYKRCGFGKKTGITFPGEQAGFVNPPRKWTKQSIMSLSYGYEMNATLLQLACSFCMIANKGIPVKPRLLLDQKVEFLSEKPLYSAESMERIRTILEKTVLKGSGKKTNIKGYTIMGKTGTAILLINGHYDPDHNIFTFSGIIEKGDYKRVIVTFVKEAARKHHIYASMVAVPLFEAIAQKLLIHDKIL